MHADPQAPNRLAAETSPYLRQHAHNPVQWHPWDAAALELARREHKPILLSIGYAACHWCHVMAHESFEDPDTAAVMNRLFVNIKVDREERPDLDRLYQLAQQMLTGRSGGWPLTMFLLPDDQRPFFGGTYFPPQARHGLPAFRDLLVHVERYFREHPGELRGPADAVVASLQRMNPVAPGDVVLSDRPLRDCRAALERSFDGDWGGFGDAPKFPHPPFIARLLRDWYASAHDTAPDLQALYMATLTLTRMADGGIHDQLGGGFCRYSVDERWAIPHFEKMLYDNAQLLAVYAEAAIATGDARFQEVAAGISDWLLADMRAPDNGFYSSLDADSEGHEGRYYVWSQEQVRALLGDEEFSVAAPHFGLALPPNFEGAWHLVRARSVEDLAVDMHRSQSEVQELLAAARRKLLAQRATRVRPGCDDKRLTSWNALTIRALAIAARTLQRPDLAEAAVDALSFLRERHWREGRLLATSNGGEARLMAYLDDYAFLADAALELCCTRFSAGTLRFGIEVIEAMLRHFAATEGGFHFTADDHETLISRPMSYSDDALPAGNGVAAYTLQRFGFLLGETRYLAAAEATLRTAWPVISQHPQHHVTMLQALEEQLSPPQIVILRGAKAAIETWRDALARVYAPHRLVLAVPDDHTDLPPALASKPGRGEATAYVCRGPSCSEPLVTFEALAAALLER